MSDFKEGDLLEHRASGERCVFVYELKGMDTCVVLTGLGRERVKCETFALKKVKEESK